MLNSLFGFFLRRETDSTEVKRRRHAYATWLCSSIPEQEFESTDRVLYHYIEAGTKIGQALNRDTLEVLMESELRTYLLKTKIKVPGTEEFSLTDQTQIKPFVQTTKELMLVEFDALMEEEAIDLEDFPAQAKIFFDTMKQKRLVSLYTSGFSMINNIQHGVVGTDDAFEYSEVEISKIKDIYNPVKLKDLGLEEDSAKGKFSFVTDFGIPSIDTDCIGIYTGQLFDIEAGPGAGKTRFALGSPVYRAATIHKVNVLYFAIEQGRLEIEAMLISRHLFELYNIRVPDSSILKNLITDEDLLAKIEIAREDLFNSGNHGKIEIVEGSLLLNNMIDRMKVLDSTKGPFQLIVIDYMFMLRFQPTKEIRTMDRVEVTRQGYQDFKAYLRYADKAGISINQFNKEGILASRADKEIDETMGAGGIEAFRSTDYNIAMTCTKAMEAQRKRRFQNPKKRGTTGYGSALVSVALDVSYFYEEGGNF